MARISLGDSTAQCPSLEQLQGVVDINDPCQNSGIPMAGAAASTSFNTTPLLTASQVAALPAGMSLPSTSTSILMVAGIGLMMFLAVNIGGRR